VPSSPYSDVPVKKVMLLLLLRKTFGGGCLFNFNYFADCFLCLDKDMAFIASGKTSAWN